MTLLNLLASRSSRMKASEIRELLKLLDQPDIISFAGGIPDPSLFPAEAIGDAYQAVLGGKEAGAALQYQVSEGYLPLRKWLAGYMDKLGVACDEGNIFITSGSQQALDYLGKLFLSPGDTALVTWPTYLGALQAFNAYEPRYDRLNTAGGNMTPEAYRAAAAANGGKVKFAYLVPDFANPTGNTLDARQREAVLDLAGELEIAVIEDAAYRALRYDGEAVPPILALDCARSGGIDKARTLYCGSFSKILSPGMRVGWVCAPRHVVEKLVLMKQASDLHSPSINQMVMHRVAETIFDAQVEKLIGAYRRRRDALLGALEANMPKGISWSRPDGGMFVWLTLPEGADATDLLARSVKDARVAFVPGNAFYADGTGRDTLRMSFTLADDRAVNEGVPRLATVLRG
ncbi:PLP-dependent aminotransferase family protein [Mesorhizobium sp. M1C.F.Ca.ET.193.01.1.1]|nr:PLP-dependent aminotransferase family protein [Mesorhizobium sp. M1C.F.Ca.ET.210.01.1.1]TGQ64325.1 PLP-dependent aminotransferase family protein [Mesorhizobium sp. M1C.F.Ca.ET.212.01.1.1]TGQ98061.1 PLP-dependent aminotransferase family protein [Mesorhizobium sp. M1C.F.Ca.ET.204.01.1.1]TGR18285.1 PLP-dependent aminotransferase family protein [Mesorhizobium sp. M1C.F.Ca.ET.196.01.1.1]TGR40335.1 PLP-dependent aminotransferase family protein [Mesorhizobium sp. M1C.F.Ca.ET.195.01.1.1]TGR60766.1 